MTRHSPYEIKLSPTDRDVLEKRSRSYTARHADVVRAKIVLLAADGQHNTAIAARLDVHVNVVRTWRKRFFEAGLAGLDDRPRPGRPRSVPSELAEGVVVPVTGRRRSPRQRHRPSADVPAPAGKLIPFQPRHNAATTLDALRQLVSSINRYLAEVDAENARSQAGGRGPTGP
jgi:Winged helix-turn helix